VDFIVNEANWRGGLYISFLPTWDRFWHDKSETRKPLFSTANAESMASGWASAKRTPA